ncbi:hypothetical protein C8J56DRAFT_1025807 [Mycena floridula]|nr:hypothetical protein C8J56DRAFT_1025807 [Mycena floridula]
MRSPDDDSDGSVSDEDQPSKTKSKNKKREERVVEFWLQKENGELITLDRKDAMLVTFRAWCNDQLSTPEPLPANFKNIGLTLLRNFQYSMESIYPELRYCEDHRKANQLFISNYHSWHKNHAPKEKRGKKRARDREDEDAKKKKVKVTKKIKHVKAPVSLSNSLPKVIPSGSPIASDSPDISDDQDKEIIAIQSQIPDQPAPEPLPIIVCADAIRILLALKSKITALPNSVPLADETHPFAAYSGDPFKYVEDGDLTKLAAAVVRGPKGLIALLRLVAHLVKIHGIKGALLEGSYGCGDYQVCRKH